MAEIWKPQPRSVILHWIDKCREEAELTDWEHNFINSLCNQLQFKEHLSQAQQDRLEQIYADKTK